MTCLTITEYPSQMTTDMFVLTTVTRRVSLVWPELLILFFRCVRVLNISASGAETGFQVRGGGELKKIAPSGGRRENVWGISCEKSLSYAKKIIFFQLWREARKYLGYFV
jgi:hypothetical protein